MSYLSSAGEFMDAEVVYDFANMYITVASSWHLLGFRVRLAFKMVPSRGQTTEISTAPSELVSPSVYPYGTILTVTGILVSDGRRNSTSHPGTSLQVGRKTLHRGGLR
jgi:hypothetical protein